MACASVQAPAPGARRQLVRMLPLEASALICRPGPRTSAAACAGSAGSCCQAAPALTMNSARPALRMTPAALARPGAAAVAAVALAALVPMAALVPTAVERIRAPPSGSGADSAQRPLG